ncbi:hypothetical protein BgiBS90_001111, partial [Biomphalaria glabrata]
MYLFYHEYLVIGVHHDTKEAGVLNQNMYLFYHEYLVIGVHHDTKEAGFVIADFKDFVKC